MTQIYEKARNAAAADALAAQAARVADAEACAEALNVRLARCEQQKEANYQAIKLLADRTERLEAALKWYANTSNWTPYSGRGFSRSAQAHYDEGARARAALADSAPAPTGDVGELVAQARRVARYDVPIDPRKVLVACADALTAQAARIAELERQIGVMKSFQEQLVKQAEYDQRDLAAERRLNEAAEARIAELERERDDLTEDILVVKKSADYHKSQDCMEMQNTIIAQRDAAWTSTERLEAALLDAVECVEHWSAYASDYFKDKHDLEGDLTRLRAALSADASKATPAPVDAAYVLVPREPSERIIKAGAAVGDTDDWAQAARIYRAMIEASQQGGDKP